MTPTSKARRQTSRGTGSPSWDADPRVDAYIDRLPAWQRAICQQVRQLAHAADPEVQETIKRSVQPYFVLHGNIAALLAAKDHINVFIYDPTVPDPHGIINLGRDNVAARGIQIYQHDTINAPALLAIFRAVIANNRAGGWQRLTKPPGLRTSLSIRARVVDDGPRVESIAVANATIEEAPFELRWECLVPTVATRASGRDRSGRLSRRSSHPQRTG
jgi:hypothetical protein